MLIQFCSSFSLFFFFYFPNSLYLFGICICIGVQLVQSGIWFTQLGLYSCFKIHFSCKNRKGFLSLLQKACRGMYLTCYFVMEYVAGKGWGGISATVLKLPRDEASHHRERPKTRDCTVMNWNGGERKRFRIVTS